MDRYRNSKIYVIKSDSTDKVYVGSTTERLSIRMSKHKCKYKRYLLKKSSYVTAFQILKFNNAYIEILESFPCNIREDLLKREGHYIKSLNTVNTCVAGRTRKQHYLDNKEKIALDTKEKRQCLNCNRYVRKHGLRRHERSKICKIANL